MGIITKIEDKLGDIVERPFRSKKGFEPLIIEVTIRRRLEASKKNILGKIVVPHSISIILDETVYNEFKPFMEHFRDSMMKSLSEWTKENGYEMLYELDLQFKKGSQDERKFDVFVSYQNESGKSADDTKDIGRKTSLSGFPIDGNPSSGKDCGQAAMTEQNTECGSDNERGGGIARGHSTEKRETKATVWMLVNTKTGEKYDIRGGETIIGRDEDCDVTISDPTVSRIHAFILCQNGKFMLEDLGSSGTRVNHERINRKSLADGDRINIGEKEFIFSSL